MLLTSLEIVGFKSFAKTATLKFPVAVSAIVGPNGSGKSNVADALRWVLGEQSMKSLRGKRGEDLIFGGTNQVPRMGKAQVSLTFDNKNKTFPIEFDELVITRRVYRDGVNEYLLNGSQARLRDIVELLSKVGLGASQHHIIAQGDADRFLYASIKERKAMIEEALGLKIYELKKQEAERKLTHTSDNIKHVESLRREIQPHLKYLKAQSEKMEHAEKLKEELENLSRQYVARSLVAFDKETNEIKNSKSPLESKFNELTLSVQLTEKSDSKAPNTKDFFEKLRNFDKERNELLDKRREIEKTLWQNEMRAKKEESAGESAISRAEVKSWLATVLDKIEIATKQDTIESMRSVIDSVVQIINKHLDNLMDKNNENEVTKEDESRMGALRDQLKQNKEKEIKIFEQRRKLENEHKAYTASIEDAHSQFKKKHEELMNVREALRSVEIQEEQLDLQKKELSVDFNAWVGSVKPSGDPISSSEGVDMRKKIERMRIKLEDAGGLDDSVVKEFEETQKRDSFLALELDDLKKTQNSLTELFVDLETQIARDFETGISKINVLFGEFFKEIFGGGKAMLKILKPKKHSSQNDDEDFEVEIEEEGLDISVDIPRKRIRSLAMLSGGERALTSIALLFAVSAVNPPPFLVLDETDAALDEANSTRYSRMLKDLSKKTQLVVITHNRETMRIAQVLYGVTMGGEGVSKLLSVQLEEAEEMIN